MKFDQYKMSKILNQIILYSFYLFSILIFLCSLTGYFDRLHRYFEFAVNFKLQYFLLSLCIFFFWLLHHRYSWLILSFVCILLNLAPIMPWYFTKNQPVFNTKYEQVKILVFNVLHQNQRYHDAIKLVRDRNIDLAAFLEATPPWDTELLALKEILPYHFSAKQLQIELYSKYPFKEPEIQIFGNHRGLLFSQLTVGKANFLFVATHAYPQLFFGDWGWHNRNKQLEEGIGKQFKKVAQPLIVGGDLNVTMWSSQYQSMIANSGLRNARQGYGILPTQSVFFPQIPWLAIPIDHFLVSKDILVTNMQTGGNIGSDHLPILLDALIPETIK